ncbi:MAG: hypothetical protein ACRDNW_00435 [Trebonia sp.]
MNVILIYVIPVVGVALAVAGTWYARWSGGPAVREERRERSRESFRAVRRWMREPESQRQMVAAACREHAGLLAAAPMSLFITDPAWVLPGPLDLDRLTVKLAEDDVPRVEEERYEPLRRYWPLGADDRPARRYHEAVTEFDTSPGIWFNAPSYRLLGVERREDGGFELRVGTTTYWDGYDSWAGLQFEAAHQLRESGGASLTGPYRRSLGSPFCLTNRNCAIGISVLAICRTRKGPLFYLQHRSGAGVATMGGMVGLVPAGEFQPSSAAYAALLSDADVWRCIMREFAEEFFGREDLTEQRAALVDYERESPFRELELARLSGWVRPYVLDIGFDPVSWKAGVRLVCIFDEDAYLDMFRGMLAGSDEGHLELSSLVRVGDEPLEGMPFDEETVRRYLKAPTITEAARLCLGLTWKYRTELGLA